MKNNDGHSLQRADPGTFGQRRSMVQRNVERRKIMAELTKEGEKVYKRDVRRNHVC